MTAYNPHAFKLSRDWTEIAQDALCTLLRPSFLARYKATSAPLSRVLPSLPCSGVMVQTPTLTVENTEAYNLFNMNFSWRFNERMRVRGGVDNIVDQQPPIVGANPTNANNPTNAMGVTSPGNYDTLGRRYYVGLAVSF